MVSMIVSLAISLFGAAWSPGESFAEPSVVPQMAATAYQDGKITGIYETTFQIDHRSYSLTSDAILLDRHGDTLNPSDLRVDIEVKYHLEKGSKDKVDRMILFLPE